MTFQLTVALLKRDPNTGVFLWNLQSFKNAYLFFSIPIICCSGQHTFPPLDRNGIKSQLPTPPLLQG